MAMLGNQFIPPTQAEIQQQFGPLANRRQGQPGLFGGGLMSSGFMPRVMPYRSAISYQPEMSNMIGTDPNASYNVYRQLMNPRGQLQYNPLVNLVSPPAGGFLSPSRPRQQMQMQQQQMPVAQNMQDYVQQAIQKSQRGLRQGRPSGRLSADQ